MGGGWEGDGRSETLNQEDNDTCVDAVGPPKRMFCIDGNPGASPHVSEETYRSRGRLWVGGHIRPAAALDRSGGRVYRLDAVVGRTGKSGGDGCGVVKGHDGPEPEPEISGLRVNADYADSGGVNAPGEWSVESAKVLGKGLPHIVYGPSIAW